MTAFTLSNVAVQSLWSSEILHSTSCRLHLTCQLEGSVFVPPKIAISQLLQHQPCLLRCTLPLEGTKSTQSIGRNNDQKQDRFVCFFPKCQIPSSGYNQFNGHGRAMHIFMAGYVIFFNHQSCFRQISFSTLRWWHRCRQFQTLSRHHQFRTWKATVFAS